MHWVSLLISRLQVRGVPSSQSAINSLQPSGEATAGDLGIDVGSWARKKVEAGLFGGIEKWLQSKNAISPVVTRLAFEQSPVNVERNTVESKGFDFLENIKP